MDEAGRAQAVGLAASRDGRPRLAAAVWLTDRRVSVALMAFVAAVCVVGAIVPQRVNTPPARFEAWRASAGAWGSVAVALGLDSVFTAWWFAAVLALFAVSLVVATARMVGGAARHTRRAGERGGWALQVLVRAWATPVLHLGLALGLVAAAASAAFSSRAVLDLSAGEIHAPGAAYLVEDGGPLAGAPELGGPVRLDAIETEEWESGELKSLTARLSVQRDGEWVSYSSAANDPLRSEGHVVYVQPGEFGEAAFLEVRQSGEVVARSRMEFAHVPTGEVAYGDIALSDGTVIEGRWDPARTRGPERLALRPKGTGAVAAQDAVAGGAATRTVAAGDDAVVTLDVGDSAALAGYEVELVDVRQWARLIIARTLFTGWLFAAFGVIAVGSVARYLPVRRARRAGVTAGDAR